MRFVKKKKKKKKTRIKHYMNVCVNGNISKKKKKVPLSTFIRFFYFFTTTIRNLDSHEFSISVFLHLLANFSQH